METQKTNSQSQSKLTRTKSSLLRCSSPTNGTYSLGSVNEEDFYDVEKLDKKKKKNGNKKNKKKCRFGSGSGSIRFVAAPILGFFSGCSLFFYVFNFFNIGSVGPTSENVLLILLFVAVALYLVNRNKRVIHRSVSVLKHSWDGNLKRLGFSSKGSEKPVQWFIGETGSADKEKLKEKENGIRKEGVECYSNGDFYEGEFHGGKCNGSGVYHYFGSGRYEGDWVDGKYDGYGIESWARGSRYKGCYRQGLRHGYGVYRFYTGDSYSGEWCNGQSHGFGVQSCSDGSCYVGEFKFGVKHGLGCYQFRNGDKYTGVFVLKSKDKKKAYTSNVAEFDLVMQTMKSGTHDSESCLKEGTCLPLGGYSVWSSLPPINVSSIKPPKPIILTVASMDSASFFRDKSLGADSPISGLIALLAAADALSRLDGLGGLSKQLVFVVFTGEAWGYLGSRRFLVELDEHSDAVHGLNHSLIEKVFEVGSVGKGLNKGAKNYFAHAEGDSSATSQIMAALKHAQESLLPEDINIASASVSNPGIPPSSLMTFLNKNPEISGVVLEDFDSSFVNKFYRSHLDDLSNVNSSAVVAAASLVARTLYLLASETDDVQNSTLAAINVNVSLVEHLMGCLLDCDPGLSCELVEKYISPASTCASNYVGVILDEPSSSPYPGYINDVPRFIWNFLADITSIPKENNSSDCQRGCSGSNEVCIKAETDGKGICALSTTRYVPAYSTRLKFESGVWNILPPNASDNMGVVDPVWTESNWNSLGIRVYTVQTAVYDWVVLSGAIAFTILSYLAIAVTRILVAKATKRD